MLKDGSRRDNATEPDTHGMRQTPSGTQGTVARLTGFGEAVGATFNGPVTDTHAYRQFGNTAVVLVVRSIAKLIAHHIEGASA